MSRDLVSDSGSGFRVRVRSRAKKTGFSGQPIVTQIVREAFPPILRRLRGVIQFAQAAPRPLVRSAPWTSTWLSSVLTRRRANVIRVFEHAIICGGRCGKPACAAMRTHIQHRNQTAGQCRCTVCRGIEVCIVLHARRCRNPTCPIGACARRRVQDAQAVAAAPAPARLPPPAAAERATTSGTQAYKYRR